MANSFPGLTRAQVNTLIAAYAAPLSHYHAAGDVTSGVFDNARVNWAAPGAVGSTTPPSGAFSRLGIGTQPDGTIPLVVSGAATGSATLFQVTNTTSSSFLGTFELAAPSMAAGNTLTFNLGKVASTRNRASMNYFHDADGSTLNRLNFGFFSVADIVSIRADRRLGVNQSAPAANVHMTEAVAAGTSDIVDNLILSRTISGTPAAGFGQRLKWAQKSSTTTEQNVAYDDACWDVATHGTRAGTREQGVFLQATAQTAFKAIAASGGVRTAVNGAAPVARQAHIADPSGGGTQDAEARTAINAILAALENFGILLTS